MKFQLAVFLYLLVALAQLGCTYAEGPFNSFKRYQRIRSRLPQALTTHLPQVKPKASHDARYWYSPGPLQASETVQLSITMDDREFQALLKMCNDKAIEKKLGCDPRNEDAKTTDAAFESGLEVTSQPFDRTSNRRLTTHDRIFVLFNNSNAEPAEVVVVANLQTQRVLYHCTPGKHWP